LIYCFVNLLIRVTLFLSHWDCIRTRWFSASSPSVPRSFGSTKSDCENFARGCFPGFEQQDRRQHLDRELTAVDHIPQKKKRGVLGIAMHCEDPNEAQQLPVEVANDHQRSRHPQSGAFIQGSV
jgi:hypothetical protein